MAHPGITLANIAFKILPQTGTIAPSCHIIYWKSLVQSLFQGYELMCYKNIVFSSIFFVSFHPYWSPLPYYFRVMHILFRFNLSHPMSIQPSVQLQPESWYRYSTTRYYRIASFLEQSVFPYYYLSKFFFWLWLNDNYIWHFKCSKTCWIFRMKTALLSLSKT